MLRLFPIILTRKVVVRAIDQSQSFDCFVYIFLSFQPPNGPALDTNCTTRTNLYVCNLSLDRYVYFLTLHTINTVIFFPRPVLMHNSTGCVIKQLLLAVHYRVMVHLGSLESTPFLLSKLPACTINSIVHS